MSKETFVKVLNSVSGVRDFILTGWGEPLVHPNFFEFVSLVKDTDRKTTVRFTTNGLLLDEKRSQKIIQTGIDAVSISMDTLENDPSRPGHIQPDNVAENILRLVKARAKSSKPAISLQAIMNAGHTKDLHDLIRFAGKSGMNSVNLVRLVTTFNKDLNRPDRNQELEIIRSSKQLGKSIGIKVTAINDDWLPYRLMTHNDKLCIKTTYHVYVTVDGDATPCCNMRNTLLGSLLDKPLRTIWNNAGFEEFFNQQSEICSGCDSLKQRQVHK